MSNLVALSPTEQQVIDVFRQALEEAKNNQLSSSQREKLKQFAKLHEELLRRNGDLLLQQRKFIEELDQTSSRPVNTTTNGQVRQSTQGSQYASVSLKKIEEWNREAIKRLPPGERGTFAIAREQKVPSEPHWLSPSRSDSQNGSQKPSVCQQNGKSSQSISNGSSSKTQNLNTKNDDFRVQPPQNQTSSLSRSNGNAQVTSLPSQKQSHTIKEMKITESTQNAPKPSSKAPLMPSNLNPPKSTSLQATNLQTKKNASIPQNPPSQRQPNIKYPLLTTKFTNGLRSKI